MTPRSDRGAVAVETVFILALVLFPLLIGVADFGRALYSSIIVEEVAQEAANFIAFTGDEATAASNVTNFSGSGIDLSSATVIATLGSRASRSPCRGSAH